MTKHGNAVEFLESYHKLENELCHRYNSGRHKGFTKLIRDIDRKKENTVISNNLKLLESYAYLRNAIVHNREKNFIIAEPHNDVVEKIKEIEQLIINPPKVIPTFQKEVLSFSTSDSIFEAINEMFKSDFSQVPIIDNNIFVGLLNTNTITRWVGATTNKEIDTNGSTIIMATDVKDVLQFAEVKNNFKFINRNCCLHDVISFFEKDRNLEALLITHNGNVNEHLLGIITIWDLVEINQILKG